MQKRALIVSPYLDHLGGGERYMLSVAAVLESLGHTIYFGWDNLEEINQLSSMLGITLKNPQLDQAVKKLYLDHRPLVMYFATRLYDIVVYLSDGSLPLLGGKRNIVHMQVPFHHLGGKSWKNALKKKLIHAVIVNSRFTKSIVDLEYGINSTVVYPPVATVVPSLPKENIILCVGRFEPSLNAKKQDILIKAWRALSPNTPGWRLALAGACSSEAWLAELRKLALDLPVDFYPNISHADLSILYAKSCIYWHAAGYGVDETKNPELTEHFGITTVEAISAGCIPLVVPYGGQKEIVTDPQFHWETEEELVAKTEAIIATPPKPDFDINAYSAEGFAGKLSTIL
jgi:glycosyltransferase involved in cell wall biosynthesis